MEKEEDAKIRRVWVGEAERIASFHPVEGYRRESFTCQADFLQFLQELQKRGFRFQ